MSSSPSIRISCSASPSDPVSHGRRDSRGSRTIDCRFGGSDGIRDHGALESALARPRSGYYRDLIQEAAALWESLSQNHAFVDGNKRVAVTATAAFLRVNGYRLEFDDLDAFLFLTDLYETGRVRFDELARWLSATCHTITAIRWSRISPESGAGVRTAISMPSAHL